ncbi:MAG: rRNA maturation RNase YbeY [Candidatus Gastranaerophilales bacterium]|nr:rRNA maturation RNase YbeY [Candidatus Gastranaerophilales bacterium]
MNRIINVFTENIFPDWEIDEVKCIEVTRRIMAFYLQELYDLSCLNGYNFESLTFDILFCDSRKTHQINKEYRQKDYPADIITFAIFADDEIKFVLDEDINLGEIILALDKVRDEAKKHNVKDEYELYFLIAHGILHLLGFDHRTEEDYNFVVGVQKKALEYAVR